MKYRKQVHHALSELEGGVTRPQVVLTEQDLTTGSIDANQPVGRPLDWQRTAAEYS